MARSPHRIWADLYLLDRPSIPGGPKPGPPGFPVGADWVHWLPKERGTGSIRAMAPQASLSSQTSSNGERYCAGHAKGAKCTESARPDSRIVWENRVCDRLQPQCLEELV